MDFIRSLDMYKKVPLDTNTGTLSGSALSALGVTLMAALFVGEVSDYQAPQYKTDVVPYVKSVEDVNSPMRVSFNITVTEMPCAFVSLDAADSTGMRYHNISKLIQKTRVDSKMRLLGFAKAEQPVPWYADPEDEHELHGPIPDNDHESIELTGDTLEKYIGEHDYVMVDFYAPWCSWCQKLEPIWTRAAKVCVRDDLVCSLGAFEYDPAEKEM